MSESTVTPGPPAVSSAQMHSILSLGDISKFVSWIHCRVPTGWTLNCPTMKSSDTLGASSYPILFSPLPVSSPCLWLCFQDPQYETLEEAQEPACDLNTRSPAAGATFHFSLLHIYILTFLCERVWVFSFCVLVLLFLFVFETESHFVVDAGLKLTMPWASRVLG